MTIGTNYSQMPYNYDSSMYGTKYGTTVSNQSYLTSTQNADSFSSKGGDNTCTDGKDDGKIGFFSALGNAVQGIGKTIKNGIKGMFTNKEGKFSLGKTLLTIGTAAVCIAVPAVGVAACAVGGVMGAVQVGKGIGNAVSAKTDAQAKQAWEDIGGGTFTVAASVVGAKAGMKAVAKTSTATNGLASLDDTATAAQKLSAFGKDMVSSTKNGVANLKSTATNFASTAKAKVADLKANPPKISNLKAKASSYYEAAKIKYAEAKAAGIDPNSALTPDEMSLLRQIDARRGFASDETLAILDKLDDMANAAAGLKSKAPSMSDVKATTSQYAHGLKSKTSQFAQGVKTTVTGAIKDPKTTIANAVTKFKGSLSKEALAGLVDKLSAPAKQVWTEFTTGKYSYSDLVSKYGYGSVAEVIQMMGGSVFAEDMV